MPRNDEPTFNRALADVLRTRNPRWQDGKVLGAEQLDVLQGGGQPDIFIDDPDGAPVIVETEFSPAGSVESDAQNRLNKTVKETGKTVEQVIALRAPANLRNVAQSELAEAVQAAEFEYCLYSISAPSQERNRWPTSGWLNGNVNDLAQLIETASVSERAVAKNLKTLEDGIVATAGRLQQGTRDRPKVRQRIAGYLHQEEGEQTARMAMAIVANAITFHTIIAGAHDVKTIDELRTSDGTLPKRPVLLEWERILRDINYWPIFHIAWQIMLVVPNGLASQILNELAEVSSELAASGITRSHDLSGRMFQRLIADRKFLATFYTLPSSATLLAELAVARLNVEWSDPKAIERLRIGDFASGTGTLLAAAYHAVQARHRRRGGDDSKLHTTMMEKALVAADIMPAATHLTTSMLSSVHPTHIFRRTQVHTLRYGASSESPDLPISLGSLNLCSAEAGQDLYGTGIRVASGESEDEELEHRDTIRRDSPLAHDALDLVIMNPPFTRPTNHETAEVPVPSFAGFATSDDEQRVMSERLKRVKKAFNHHAAGHGNAGLASNFLDLAHLKCRPGGILALVMPLSLVQGEAWRPARDLLATWYEDITLVTLSAAGSHEKSFSADTGMGEVLVVARKRSDATAEPDQTRALFANLHQRPTATVDAMEIARHLCREHDALSDIERITIGDQDVGTTYRAYLRQGGCAGVADLELASTAIALESNELQLPTLGRPRPLAMARLGQLGERGLVHRDINGLNSDKSYRGPFDIIPPSSSQPTYPALWSHDADSERQLVVAPDREGQIRPGMEDKANTVWSKASRLHFNLDFQLNSQSLAAAITERRSIGGRAWPNFRLNDPAHEYALVLWSNTTLGLFLFWWHASRQQAGRAILTISQLPSLLVIDTTKLTSNQLAAAQRTFDKYARQTLLPVNEAFRDEVRIALDEDFLIQVIGLNPSILEPLKILRNKWCAEPSVHGGKSTRIQ